MLPRKTFVYVTPFILLLIASPAAAAVSAHDGDTITIDGTRYRISVIDAPELKQPWEKADGSFWAYSLKAHAIRAVASNWRQWVGTVEEAGTVEPETPKRKNTHLGHHARALFDADPSRRFWGGFRPVDPPGRRRQST